MNLFGRRRKESSQPLSQQPSTPSKGSSNPISILSASLPKSYRQQQQQQNGSSTTPQKGQKNGSLPPTPPIIVDKENTNVKPRAHHATAPASATAAAAAAQHQYHHNVATDSGGMHINELGQMESRQQPHQNGQPAFMVNGSGAGQQHHHQSTTLPSAGAGKHSLPPIPRDPSSSKDLNLKAFPNLKVSNRRMSTGSIPSIDAMLSSNKAAETAELQVCQYVAFPSMHLATDCQCLRSSVTATGLLRRKSS